MSIARYDLTEDCTTGKVDITPVPETMEGRYVSYEDYAALEAKCAALAAENAGLREYRPQPSGAAMMEALDVYQAGADEVPELAMLSAYKKLRDGLKIPATDAFLAEVRAQGVEMLREHPAIKLCSLTHLCDEFAAQLRKGVQS